MDYLIRQEVSQQIYDLRRRTHPADKGGGTVISEDSSFLGNQNLSTKIQTKANSPS